MQDFTTKRNALFACLDDASKELKGTSLDQGERSMNILKRNKISYTQEQSLSFLCGKESIFKKPERPITKCLKARQSPDYQINPHKWKKYSLSDVDISDHTNTAAAFAFFKEMDEQKVSVIENESSEDSANNGTKMKIEFKKSSKIVRNLRALEGNEVADAEIDKPKLKGSKLIMPEYVVGQKRQEKKKKLLRAKKDNENRASGGTLRLSHLQEECNDDYDDIDDENCDR